MHIRSATLLVTCGLLAACSNDEPAPAMMAGDGGVTSPSGSDVPSNAAALLAFLQAESYAQFAAESAVHAATNGSPHNDVRVFINDTLSQSLAGGQTSHPVGSAAIKELYDTDQTTRIGWAVSVKTQADSAGGQGWYWYEIINGSVVADAKGLALCTGCHQSTGQDFFSSNYPLQ